MGPNPAIGVLFHWLGGLASASNFIPFRGIRRWSWEIYWIIQGVAAWLIAPTLIATLLVPDVWSVLRAAPPASVGYAIFWGALWGIGGLTFGLAIRYLGLGLGYAIALGFCTAFGTLIPPIWHGQMHAILTQRSGRVILAGVMLCLFAIAVSGAAGHRKEKEIDESEKAASGERDFSFVKGLAVAVFAGIMSSFFAVGLDAGKPIADIARAQLLAAGKTDLWASLPVLIVVLWGGFVTNLIWSSILIVRNKSGRQFLGQPGRNPMSAEAALEAGDTAALSSGVLAGNYLFAILAGVLWYFQFFFYSMGQARMGRYDFASWTLHMASIILFATLWGIGLREWKGTSGTTRLLVACGLLLLIGSTVVVGFGSYLQTH